MLIKIKKGVELAVCFWLSWRLLPPRDGTPGWCGTGPHDGMQNLQASTSRCHLVLEAEHSPRPPYPRTTQRQPKLYITILGLFPSTGSTKKKNLGKLAIGRCVPVSPGDSQRSGIWFLCLESLKENTPCAGLFQPFLCPREHLPGVKPGFL